MKKYLTLYWGYTTMLFFDCLIAVFCGGYKDLRKESKSIYKLLKTRYI